MKGQRRLLTVGHSYVVALNRRLPHEIARVSGGRWEVTVAAPKFMHGDLRPITLEHFPNEACRLVPVSVYLSRRAHIMLYGRRLRSLLREPWDLVHCWEEPYVAAGYQVARWATRGQAIAYYSFQNIAKRYPPPFNWIERYSMRRATSWIAAGQGVAQTHAHRRGYSGKPHRILPLGVDTGAFTPNADEGARVREALGWKGAFPPTIGFLGRFIPEKGLRLLMAALDAVNTPWRVLFVGGGPLELELGAWAATHTDDRVRICTDVTHDQVPPYLNAMDILVAPSQTTRRWKEQFGRMLVEGMACGVPVVGSDSGEIPFVIGDAGVVLPEADVAAWTKGLAELLESPARRAELGARGRAKAEAEFAWPVVARKHLEFFDELIGFQRTASP